MSSCFLLRHIFLHTVPKLIWISAYKLSMSRLEQMQQYRYIQINLAQKSDINHCICCCCCCCCCCCICSNRIRRGFYAEIQIIFCSLHPQTNQLIITVRKDTAKINKTFFPKSENRFKIVSLTLLTMLNHLAELCSGLNEQIQVLRSCVVPRDNWGCRSPTRDRWMMFSNRK